MSESDKQEEEIAPWDLLTGALSSLQDIDEPDEDPVLNVLEGGGDPALDGEDALVKVPLEQAKNLIKLRRLTQELEEGSRSKDDFLNGIRPMHRSLENGIKLVTTPAVQRQLADLDEVEREIFDDTHAAIKVLMSGIARMLSYKETENLDDVRAGLQIVEESMQELDEIQDEAIELAAEEYDEEEYEEEDYED